MGSNPILSELMIFLLVFKRRESLLGGMVDTVDLKSILQKVSVQVR